MGLSQATIREWMDAAPSVEADEAWPPFVRPEPGTKLHLVCRWDEGRDPGWFWRQVVRFAYWSSGGKVWLSPQRLEIIGPASSEESARAACRDETYCSFPLTVDRFLPREPVNLRGVRFWKRRMRRLFWHPEPGEVDEGLYLTGPELRRIDRALKG
jgi:hypothetical protein